MAKGSECRGSRLSAADTQMLEYRRPGTPLFTGGSWLLTFEGSCPRIGELREHVASRLSLLPRLWDRVEYLRPAVVRPRWVRDSSFDLSWHVREADRTRFAAEGGWLRLAGERMGTELDRRRPLWQLWLAGGAEDRFAVLLHHHHALADGHSALHILRVLFAADAGGVPAPGKRVQRKRDAPTRLREGAEAARCIAAALRLLYPPAPSVPPLNRPLGSRRRVLVIDVPMRRVMEIAMQLGCFPNDVYLTAVAGGLRRWLEARDVSVGETTLQAGVPVKTASRADRQELGNHFSGIRLPLPLGEADPVARLRRIQAATKQITDGRIARGGELMTRAHNVLPRQLLGPTARMEWGPQAMNIVASHLALPHDLGELLGRPLGRLYCWTPLFEDHAVSVVAAQGLGGTMTINLLVEPALVPDADVLKAGISETIEALYADAVGVGEASAASRS